MLRRKTILVVDDDPFMRDIVNIQLGSLGYQVMTASSGKRAVELIREQRPDAVVLDFAMPDLSGLEVLKQIRAQDAGDPVPVLMLTAWHSDEAKIATQRLGARWMEKPVWGEDLVDAVDAVVGAT